MAATYYENENYDEHIVCADGTVCYTNQMDGLIEIWADDHHYNYAEYSEEAIAEIKALKADEHPLRCVFDVDDDQWKNDLIDMDDQDRDTISRLDDSTFPTYAIDLYERGYRSDEREDLTVQYSLWDDEADRVCAALREIEEKEEWCEHGYTLVEQSGLDWWHSFYDTLDAAKREMHALYNGLGRKEKRAYINNDWNCAYLAIFEGRSNEAEDGKLVYGREELAEDIQEEEE